MNWFHVLPKNQFNVVKLWIHSLTFDYQKITLNKSFYKSWLESKAVNSIYNNIFIKTVKREKETTFIKENKMEYYKYIFVYLTNWDRDINYKLFTWEKCSIFVNFC